MIEKGKIIVFHAIFLSCICLSFKSFGQRTQIRGFMDVLTGFQDDKVSFTLGEQDLFITSELSDRFSFLGESVFKFTPGTPTTFSVSIERAIVKYNFMGNHNLLIGKHHTPINYWNDTYHHGRVLFPTIYRPLLFEADIIPLHTTGVTLQGQNLGNLKFGYDVMVGNGLGSDDVLDNDKRKSITAAVHIKPAEGLRIGFSWYNDEMAAGSRTHDGKLITWNVQQNLFSPSIAYFGNKIEVLAESTLATNHTDTTGSKQTFAGYIYAGLKIKERLVPYIRFDRLHFQEGEILFDKNNTTSIVGGIRYNINYLTVVKLEYQHEQTELDKNINKLTFQIAVGF
jgi:hypothetical protein